jgi:antitoxin component YwqK of YwqJK toxin-antitoxin module
MNHLKVLLVVVSILTVGGVFGQTIDPFKISVETFDKLGLKNGDEVTDRSGVVYRVVNRHSKRGLEVFHEGAWKKHGNYFLFHSNGKVDRSSQYHYNLKHGTEKRYFKDGQINWEFAYENDVKNGKFVIYFQAEGNIYQTGSYLNGKRHGTMTTYHQNGQVREIKPYVDGKVKGTVLQYDEKGKKISEITY